MDLATGMLEHDRQTTHSENHSLQQRQRCEQYPALIDFQSQFRISFQIRPLILINYELMNNTFVSTISNILLNWSVFNMQKVLVIEAEKCAGCRQCETWCSFLHTAEVTPARSRIHIIKWDERGLDIPMTCQQCEEPICAKVCPVNAITKNRDTGLVSVDEARCVGCGLCVIACPFGGCSMDPITHKMFKCDLCGGDPQCVQKCPRDVISFEPASKITMKKKRASAARLSELIEKIASPSHA